MLLTLTFKTRNSHKIHSQASETPGTQDIWWKCGVSQTQYKNIISLISKQPTVSKIQVITFTRITSQERHIEYYQIQYIK
jgi:hypothetical protein